MKIGRVLLKTLMPLAALSACAAETGATEPASSGTSPAAVDADPALWVVKDADTTVYLFGTVHVLKPGLTWFDEAVREAFDASDTVVLEMVEPDQATMVGLITKLGVATDGKTLRDRMSADARARYEAAMTATGLQPAMFDRFEPWMAAVNLTVISVMAAGYDPASGAEKGLGGAASSGGKTVIGLETPEQQLGYFDTIPMQSQLAFLDATVTQVGEVKEGMERMVGAWARADTEELGQIMQEGLDDPIVHKALISDRNARWADWIEERMKQPGTVFVAVGAGHLAGKDSVQGDLEKAGLTVTRVRY